MALSEFLVQHKKEIIQLCREKVADAGESKPTSALLDSGLPLFYNELIEVLEKTAAAENKKVPVPVETEKEKSDAAVHGKESLRLGYTISQVVHSYGAVCQSITEFVQDKSFTMSPLEFHDLNLCLDRAIADAVSEFEITQKENVSNNEAERLGSLIHEMANAVAAASIAHKMIEAGRVGIAGTTSAALSRSLERMRHLINTSLTEIHLGRNAPIDSVQIRLIDIISEIEAAALIMKTTKDVHSHFDVDPSIELSADRQMVFSALSNLVDNALKFTKKHGNVTVRAKESGGRVLIEVEDECGGLPEGKIEELFKAFVQKSSDKTGMGLGLSISRRAIELNNGKLTARNISGKGCVFTVDLPKNAKVVQSQSPDGKQITDPAFIKIKKL